MTGGGIATAGIVYLLKGSLGWAVVGLLSSGVVLNAIGQAVTQPIKAVTESDGRHRGDRTGSNALSRCGSGDSRRRLRR